ncbi:hypothetical protein ACFVTF_05410 [Kitasatospora sp. NPDC057940]|uniref:hypothetical protein n=1 Tax=Kitasatospora sp. NPDC057940 TaxID=3346285 RepID=UPI0036DE54EF
MNFPHRQLAIIRTRTFLDHRRNLNNEVDHTRDQRSRPAHRRRRRAIATLKDIKAPAEQRYELSLPAGTEVVANETGGYDLIRPVDGGVAVTVGRNRVPKT